MHGYNRLSAVAEELRHDTVSDLATSRTRSAFHISFSVRPWIQDSYHTVAFHNTRRYSPNISLVWHKPYKRVEINAAGYS